MSSTGDRPRVSVVIEHETASLVSASRVRTVLQELARQVRNAPHPVEVLVPTTADIDDEVFEGLPVRRFSVMPGAHYYEVKNAGARAAAAEIIVFADSDVLPADGWLDHLVGPFGDPTVDAVVGSTEIRPVVTAADKAFAAATWWPAHHEEVRDQIVAHCFAVRRAAFLPAGFPDIGCRYRGADTDLHHSWDASGIRVAAAPGARSDHPPPEHPIRRALWDGHDQQISASASGRRFVRSLARVVLHQLLVGSVRIWRHRRAVGVRIPELPVTLVMNLREALARGAGFTLARFAHPLMHRVPR